MTVVDASAIVALLLSTRVASSLSARLFVPGETLHAPHLIDIEVVQVLRRYAASGQISDRRGQVAIGDLTDLSLQRYPHAILLPRVWDLRHNLSAYDATYVALAEALGAPLVTMDGRIAGAPGHTAKVEVF